MWKTRFEKSRSAPRLRIHVDAALASRGVSRIAIWNFNQTHHLDKGVKNVRIFVEDRVVFEGVLDQGRLLLLYHHDKDKWEEKKKRAGAPLQWDVARMWKARVFDGEQTPALVIMKYYQKCYKNCNFLIQDRAILYWITRTTFRLPQWKTKGRFKTTSLEALRGSYCNDTHKMGIVKK